MGQYVDVYVVPIAKRNVAAYRRLALLGKKVFLQHGALEYRENIGDDLKAPVGVPFPRAMKLKAGETVVCSWIVFKSRAHRDAVNAKAMKDPRMSGVDLSKMPFDCRRMVFGGFKTLVAG